MFHFDSRFSLGASLPAFTEADVKNEPMLFNCDLAAAEQLGGPITKAFLSALGDYSGDAVLDSRVHMLMPGWYPCIPGWHHDDIPRSRSDGQPNYVSPEYHAHHAMALINGDICPTQFAVGECDMPDVPLRRVIYKEWHGAIEHRIEAGKLSRISAPSNRIIYFDSHTFHQGQQAIGNGWRWFGRVSFDTGRKPTNEVRQQVQVYLEFPTEGW